MNYVSDQSKSRWFPLRTHFREQSSYFFESRKSASARERERKFEATQFYLLKPIAGQQFMFYATFSLTDAAEQKISKNKFRIGKK